MLRMRVAEKAEVRIRAASQYLGAAAIAMGAVELLPLSCIFFYPDQQSFAPFFIFPGLGAMVAGYLLLISAKGTKAEPNPRKSSLSMREAAACTLSVWIFGILLYAIPFVLAGLLSPSLALFEATSGLTTTGLSVVDANSCPAIFLLYRSFMQYLGGVGLVLVLACVIGHNSNLRVYNLEGHTDRLLPGTARTARAILILYTTIISLGTIAYHLAGMTWFDAVNTAMSSVSTGGFCTHSESIGYFNSPVIEAITVVLMLLGATNFLLLFLLLKGQMRACLSHIETPMFYGVVTATTLLITFLLVLGADSGSETSIPQAFRIALFQVVSVITSCGYQTIPSFNYLSPSILFVLTSLMIVGSYAGSTAGGIKMYRVSIAAKGQLWSLQERYGNKHRICSRKINRFGKRVSCSEQDVADAKTYMVMYVAAFASGAFAFTLCGASLQQAVFDFASCLGNTGVGIGFLSSQSGPVELMVGCMGMLLGRLEIVPVFMGLCTMLQAGRNEIHER